MNRMQIWNNYELANEETAQGKKIFVPFGKWPWNESIDQVFRKDEAEEIAAKLAKEIAAGEPGIPVYQGHPDVPELAAKYPDKGALGWVKEIEVQEEGCLMTVEWDRWPGKGFAWFSPYWAGEPQKADGKVTVTVSEIRSIGLVNRPNIHAFRLPNEELDEAKKEKTMNKIMEALGLANDATAEEAVKKIGELKEDAEKKEADKAKAEADKVALEDECKKQKCSNEELQKKLGAATAELANSKKELEESKTALANEKAEVEKLKGLKTQSVTAGLANEKKDVETRMSLVNEIMQKQSLDFDAAWCLAKSQKPDLFK